MDLKLPTKQSETKWVTYLNKIVEVVVRVDEQRSLLVGAYAEDDVRVQRVFLEVLVEELQVADGGVVEAHFRVAIDVWNNTA